MNKGKLNEIKLEIIEDDVKKEKKLENDGTYLIIKGKTFELKNYIIGADLKTDENNNANNLITSEGNMAEVLVLKSMVEIMLQEKHRQILFSKNI